MNARQVMALIRASDKPHYVYILRKPDGTPFYVGVGTQRRLLAHEEEAKRHTGRRGRKHATIRKIWRTGGVVRYQIAGWFDVWEDALAVEVRLIAEIGRADLGKGPLTNLTDGGEGAPGVIPSEETRRRMGAIHKGRVFSEERRRRMAEGRRGILHTPEARARMSAVHMGKSNGPHSSETRAKIAASQIGKAVSLESRARMSVAQKARFERHRAEGGLKLPHHKGRTREGRMKHSRPVEVDGVWYFGAKEAADRLGIGYTTIKRWLKSGHRGARRLPKEQKE